MHCPIRLVSLQALKNGQDAQETSPVISRWQHGPRSYRQPTV